MGKGVCGRSDWKKNPLLEFSKTEVEFCPMQPPGALVHFQGQCRSEVMQGECVLHRSIKEKGVHRGASPSDNRKKGSLWRGGTSNKTEETTSSGGEEDTCCAACSISYLMGGLGVGEKGHSLGGLGIRKKYF